jgi:hypothetical protein
VRETRDLSGRMPYRLWYEETEIDTIMEDELRRAGNPRLVGGEAVDVDAFIENHLKVTPQFVNLPAGVQGATDFFPDGRVEMRVSRELSERAEREHCAEHLMRTTLGHEGSHVCLHRQLFLRQSEEMFGTQTSRRELCRDVRFVGRGYTGEWWEWQANRGMGALLLPKSEIVAIARRARSGGEAPDERLVAEVGERYLVSRQAVRLRFEQLRMAQDRRQVAWEF